MPVSDKSIIEPGTVDAKVPLKKSTVAWAIGIALSLAMVGYYAPKLMRSDNAEDNAVEKQRTKGSAKQIDLELKAAERPIAVASAPAPAASMPAPTAEVKVAQSAVTPERDELDASARTSHSVVWDGTSSGIVGAITEAGGADEHRQARVNAALDARMPKMETAAANTGADGTDRLARIIQAQASAAGARDYDREWLKEYSELKPTQAITPKKVQNPFTLIQGKIIPAVLGKSLNSDLPGDITAFTTQDVYDSLSGNYLLIPKGSLLVGEYSNRVKAGQDRLMFAFSRIVLPNGVSFDLPGNKGEDATGASGVTGDVDNHYFKRFTSGILIAILADRLDSNNTQPVTNIGTSGGPTSAAGKVLSDIAQADLTRNKDIAPTITIQKGTRINVQVSADMEFPSPYIIQRSKRL